jgi:hypothetical protein
MTTVAPEPEVSRIEAGADDPSIWHQVCCRSDPGRAFCGTDLRLDEPARLGLPPGAAECVDCWRVGKAHPGCPFGETRCDL